MEGIVFSPDQREAIEEIIKWRRCFAGTKQRFTLGGLAGVGKSSIVKEIVSKWQGVSIVAPTGKAVNRLKQLGSENACTIHSLIYQPYEDEETGEIKYKRKGAIGCNTIVCDEASMVSQYIYDDLMSYEKPVLYVGDHGQLEPIGENPNLMVDPDFKLEKIHRQALDNPLLKLAMLWRERRDDEVWKLASKDGFGKKCKVMLRDEINLEDYHDWQIICGYNDTRHMINKTIRAAKGFTGPIPVAGEKVICLQNNRDLGIFNGQQAEVLWTETSIKTGHIVWMRLALDDGRKVHVPALRDQFGANKLVDHRDKLVALYDYAYAVTCHKCQGDEHDKVVVLEEMSRAWDPARWRYTATTRAKEELVYCL